MKIYFIIGFAVIILIVFWTGYYAGYTNLQRAMNMAMFDYCTDENRAACEDQCCILQRQFGEEIDWNRMPCIGCN